MGKRLTLDLRGVITVKDQKGQDVKIVIKLAGKGFGNGRVIGDKQVQICRYVATIHDRKSPAQLARRAKFREAVAAWRALPVEERQRLDQAARAEHQTGWNRFISEWLARPG